MALLSRIETKILLLIIIVSFLSILPLLFYHYSSELNQTFLVLSPDSSSSQKSQKIITAEDLNSTWKLSSQRFNPSSNPNETFSENGENTFLTTAKLEKDRKINPSIKCSPKSTGYSDEQASSYFSQKSFTRCKDSTKVEVVKSVENNTISIECPSSSGMYFTSLPSDKERFGRVEYKANWAGFQGIKRVEMSDREFLMVKCSNMLKAAYVRNHFNSEAANRAKSITSSLIKSLGLSSFTPFNLHMIILDSMSRSHFYRNLKTTINYLNNQLVNSKDYVVYDFLNNNAHGENTRPNLVSLLLGKNFQEHVAEIKGFNNNEDAFDTKYQAIQNTSLWKHYERMGFVTLFEYDTVWNFFCDDIGRKVYTDAKLLNFWNAAKNVFAYTDFVQKPRCFGNKNGHWFLFEYLRSFVRNYKGINKFTYMHTSIAHENTGTIVKTLDDDLKEGLEWLINSYKETKEDFLIVLAGDHGRRVMEWDRSIEGFYENKHPFHLIITKQSLIQQLGKNTHSILTHNTERLISRFDWYLSFLHLATFPYGSMDPSSQIYQSLKSSLPVSTAVSLFLEEIPDDRTCNDMKIQNLYCLCRDFEEIDKDSTFVINVLEKMAMNVFEKINTFRNSKECQTISFGKTLKVEEFVMKREEDGGNTLFRMNVDVSEKSTAVIEISFYAAQASEYKRLKINLDGKIQRTIFEEYLRGYQIYVERYRRIDMNQCPVQTGQEKVCIC